MYFLWDNFCRWNCECWCCQIRETGVNFRICLITDAIISTVDTRLRLPDETLLKGMQVGMQLEPYYEWLGTVLQLTASPWTTEASTSERCYSWAAHVRDHSAAIICFVQKFNDHRHSGRIRSTENNTQCFSRKNGKYQWWAWNNCSYNITCTSVADSENQIKIGHRNLESQTNDNIPRSVGETSLK